MVMMIHRDICTCGVQAMPSLLIYEIGVGHDFQVSGIWKLRRLALHDSAMLRHLDVQIR